MKPSLKGFCFINLALCGGWLLPICRWYNLGCTTSKQMVECSKWQDTAGKCTLPYYLKWWLSYLTAFWNDPLYFLCLHLKKWVFFLCRLLEFLCHETIQYQDIFLCYLISCPLEKNCYVYFLLHDYIAHKRWT